MKLSSTLSPGTCLLKLRQKFGKGLRVAWYRDKVRPKILLAQPTKGLTDGSAEVHVLTSSQDWINLMWTLKSFYLVAERPYSLVVHEDGSLDQSAVDHIQRLFPDARIIRRTIADKKVLPSLAQHPHAQAFRTTNALSLKLFDFPFYLKSQRMILLDSDVLFYKRPDALLDRINDPSYQFNSVNGDVSSAFTVDPEVVLKQCRIHLLERFNSGLGLIHANSIQLDWIEEFLQLPNVMSHFWRIEQTLFALCSCRHGAELLPAEYDVYLTKGLNERPCRHYVGAIRHLMYAEGMRELARQSSILH